jgi:hypothetical protein
MVPALRAFSTTVQHLGHATHKNSLFEPDNKKLLHIIAVKDLLQPPTTTDAYLQKPLQQPPQLYRTTNMTLESSFFPREDVLRTCDARISCLESQVQVTEDRHRRHLCHLFKIIGCTTTIMLFLPLYAGAYKLFEDNRIIAIAWLLIMLPVSVRGLLGGIKLTGCDLV